MIDIFKAIVLGIVQGLTEFLPVSSSGHLLLVQEMMGIEGEYMFFYLMLHFGTLAAVLTVWYKEAINLFKPPFKDMGLLAIATLPAVALVLIFKLAGFSVNELFADGKYLCFFFLVTAVLLFATERIVKKRGEKQKDVNIYSALIMGGMQAAAIFPGISRSGSTISGGLLYGVEKDKATKFSFLMSMAAILGGAVLELYDVIKAGSGVLTEVRAGAVICGMLAASLTGYLALKFVIKAISKLNFKWFSLYLAVISVISFINYFVAPIW